jgi:hypothetical protein
MNSRMKLAAGVAAALLASGAGLEPGAATRSGGGSMPTTQAAVAPPDAGELAALVKQLDADDFATREAATRRLAALPAESVPAVKRAFAARPLPAEAEARAAAIMRVLEPRLAVAVLREKNKGRHPVAFGNDPEAIPLDDTVITQIIPLNTISAVLLRNDLMPLMSADAEVTADDDSNWLVVTDTSAKVNRIVQIIGKLDNAKAVPLDVAYKPLKFSKAAEMARLMNAMFRPGNPPPDEARDLAEPATRPNPAAPPTTGRGGAAAARAKLTTGRLHADFNSQTNTVIIEGPREQIAQALEMLDRIEAQAAGKQAAAPTEPAPEEPNPDGNAPKRP